MTELEGYLFTNIWSSNIFPRNSVHIFRRDSSTCAWKKSFHSFYVFELIIHFLAGGDFYNMHSDIFLNLTPGV